MNLDEMLALLEDNTSGDIGADDLRAIVTSLYETAHTHINVVPYQYSSSATPASGKVNVAWNIGATSLNVNDLASDGSGLPYNVIDSNETNEFVLGNSDGSLKMKGTITGVSVDNGGFRTWPITVAEVIGSTPGNNAPLAFSVSVFVDFS